MKRKIIFLALSLVCSMLPYLAYPLAADREIYFITNFLGGEQNHFIVESFLPYIRITSLLPVTQESLPDEMASFFLSAMFLYVPLALMILAGIIAKNGKSPIPALNIRRTHITIALLPLAWLAVPLNRFPILLIVCATGIYVAIRLALLGKTLDSTVPEWLSAVGFTVAASLAAAGSLMFNIWNGNLLLSLFYVASSLAVIFVSYAAITALREKAVPVEQDSNSESE